MARRPRIHSSPSPQVNPQETDEGYTIHHTWQHCRKMMIAYDKKVTLNVIHAVVVTKATYSQKRNAVLDYRPSTWKITKTGRHVRLYPN